jgi:hypothetical protein
MNRRHSTGHTDRENTMKAFVRRKVPPTHINGRQWRISRRKGIPNLRDADIEELVVDPADGLTVFG